MKSLKCYFTISILLITSYAFGQDTSQKNRFPVWTYHQKNVNIHGLSLGLFSPTKPSHTNTNGMKVELIGVGILIPLIPKSPIASNDSEYVQLINEPLSERINGVFLSASGTACDCRTNGLVAGFVGHINNRVNGISAAGFVNFAQRHNGLQFAFINQSYRMNGMQAGGTNYASKTRGVQIAGYSVSDTLKGAQFSGINNSKKMNGVQVGGYNHSYEANGIQIGIVNKARNLKGIQFGLINVNQRRILPFVNWNFKDS